MMYSKLIEITTQQKNSFTDLTKEINAIVKESNVENGLVVVQVLHSTAGIIINENESNLIQDLKEYLEKVVDERADYAHHRWFDKRFGKNSEDAWAHIRTTFLLRASITLVVRQTAIVLGENQQIFLVETNTPRRRQVLVAVTDLS